MTSYPRPVGNGQSAALDKSIIRIDATLKAGKPQRVLENLWPVALLNNVRILQSLNTLNRIRIPVERFLQKSNHQIGFRTGKATTEAMWAQKSIVSRAVKYKWKTHVLGINLSQAFDSVEGESWLTLCLFLLMQRACECLKHYSVEERIRCESRILSLNPFMRTSAYFKETDHLQCSLLFV